MWSMGAMALLIALLAGVLTAVSASAATVDSNVLTICPALGTAPVVTAAGARACAPNDCASL